MEQFRVTYKLVTIDDNLENQEIIFDALEYLKNTYGSSPSISLKDLEAGMDAIFSNHSKSWETKLDVQGTDLFVTIRYPDTKETYARVNLKDIGYTVIVEVDSDDVIARRLMEVKLDKYQTRDQRKRYIYLFIVKEVKRLLEAGLKLGEIEARINCNEILKLSKHIISLTEEDTTIYIKFIDAESIIDGTFDYSTPVVDFEEQYTPADHKIRKILKEAGLSDTTLSLDQLVHIMSEQGYSNDYIVNLLLEDKDLRLRISGYYNFLKNIDIIDGYALDVLPLVSEHPYPYSLTIADPMREVKLEIGKDDIVKLEPGNLIITSGTDTTVVPLDYLKYGYTEFDEQEEKYIINIIRILIIEPKLMEIDPEVFLPKEIEDKRQFIDNGLVYYIHYAWIVVLKATFSQVRYVQIKTAVETYEKKQVTERFIHTIPYAMSANYDPMSDVWQELRRKPQNELDTIIRRLDKLLPVDAVLESCVVKLERTDITEYPGVNVQPTVAWVRNVCLGPVKTLPVTLDSMINFLTVCRWQPLKSYNIQEPFIYLDTVRDLLPNWSEETIQSAVANIKANISNQLTIDFYEEMRTALTDRGWEKVEVDYVFERKTYLQENPIKYSERLYIEDHEPLASSCALIILNEHDDNICITTYTYLLIMRAKNLHIPVIMWNSYTNSRFKEHIDSANPYIAYKSYYNLFTKINQI